MRWLPRASVVCALLTGGLVLVLPASPAGAIPIFPGNQGDLRVSFDNTGRARVQHGSCGHGRRCVQDGHRRRHGCQRGRKGVSSLRGTRRPIGDGSHDLQLPVLHRLDEPGVADALRESSCGRPGVHARRGTHTDDPADDGVVGEFTTVKVPTGATSGWQVTGDPITCGGAPLPGEFSLEELATICPGTNIVATSFGTLGGVSVVTGVSNGAGWAGWTGVIDDLRINASQYDLEPAQFTVTPASPVTLDSRDPQSVEFTLQASGWNSFPGIDTVPALDRPIIGGYEMQVGFRATGATTVTGLAGTVPVATQLTQLTSPPPPVTFTLDVTAALIGSETSIAVDWIAPVADRRRGHTRRGGQRHHRSGHHRPPAYRHCRPRPRRPRRQRLPPRRRPPPRRRSWPTAAGRAGSSPGSHSD